MIIFACGVASASLIDPLLLSDGAFLMESLKKTSLAQLLIINPVMPCTLFCEN